MTDETIAYQDIFSFILSHTKSIFGALAILIVGLLIAYAIKQRLHAFFRHSPGDQTVKLFLVNMLHGAVLLVLATIVLTQLGVPTTSLVALLGAGSIAIALAIKDSLSNIASGFLLIFLQPFKIGDVVELCGILGTVDQINLFTTRVKTPNYESIHFPNNKIMNDKIINKSFKGLRRIDMPISINYDADIKKARAIIMREIEKNDLLLGDPAPAVVVKSLADSAVVLAVRVFSKKENYATALYTLQEHIKLAFNEQGVAIPYPQLDVHLNQIPS